MVFAVHISDGILTPWFSAGGFAFLGILIWLGSRRLDEDEVPRIAVLTAAFFVASTYHLPLGPTSTHLLLNGLIGVVLGWRAALAIPAGLLLQAVFLQHGGFTSLGVNACVMSLPALAAGLLFRLLHRIPWVRHPQGRTFLVLLTTWVGLLSLVFCLGLIPWQSQGLAIEAAVGAWPGAGTLSMYPGVQEKLREALDLTLNPIALAVTLGIAALAAWLERRLENAPEFSLGLFIGELAVLLTVGLNGAALILGAPEFGSSIVWVVLLSHMPVAVVEGLIVGVMVSFLARVKPEMLGSEQPNFKSDQTI